MTLGFFSTGSTPAAGRRSLGTPPPGRSYRTLLAGIPFVILVSAIAHFTLSSLGFNPTDDGFTLASSRRILEGQIPHRDFITIRPFLSPLLHVPFVLWGGDLTYWVSRFFVWFQFACIAWIWISVMERLLKQSLRLVDKVAVGLVALAASSHTFPIMAWHTVDGLFLLSIGVALCVSKRPSRITIGYFLIGTAYLCKQSFVFAGPVILLVLGDWRTIRYWLAVLMPGILSIVILLFADAFSDAILQLTSQKGVLSAGLLSYFNRQLLIGVLLGYLSIRLVTESSSISLPLRKNLREWLGLVVLTLIPLLGAATAYVSGKRILASSFGLFGLVLGVVCYFSTEATRTYSGKLRVGLLVLVVAWSATVSIGYKYPVLFSGQLLALMLIYARPEILRRVNSRVYSLSLLALTAIFLLSFGWARTHYIYREQAASNLTRTLGGVLPGGSWIRTNENTYHSLVDLQRAIDIAKRLGKTYAIIPDYAGYWVKSPQANPIAIDWPQRTELNKQELIDRVTRELDTMRDSNVVIVQKYEANVLSNGYTPLHDGYEVVNHVRAHFTKIEETELFELYE